MYSWSFIHVVHGLETFCVVLGYEGDTPVRCLTHSFAVHTHYEVAPPYPQFLPHVSMACPGVAVFNTGDSLVALNVRVDSEQSRCHLFSMQFASDFRPPCVDTDDTGDVTINNEALVVSESAVVSVTLSSSAVHKDDVQVTESAPSADPQVFYKQKLSEIPESVGSPSIRNKWHLCVDSSETVLQCEDESHVDINALNCGQVASVCAHTPQPKYVKLTGSSSQTDCDSSGLTGVFQRSDENKEHLRIFDFPVTSSQRCDQGLAPNFRMYQSLSHAASTSCSPATISSSPVILQNDSQCFTYSIRRYSSDVTQAADIEGIRSDLVHALANDDDYDSDSLA